MALHAFLTLSPTYVSYNEGMASDYFSHERPPFRTCPERHSARNGSRIWTWGTTQVSTSAETHHVDVAKHANEKEDCKSLEWHPSSGMAPFGNE